LKKLQHNAALISYNIAKFPPFEAYCTKISTKQYIITTMIKHSGKCFFFILYVGNRDGRSKDVKKQG
jgi:hypothetical protein